MPAKKVLKKVYKKKTSMKRKSQEYETDKNGKIKTDRFGGLILKTKPKPRKKRFKNRSGTSITDI